MIPEQRLSAEPVLAPFLGARASADIGPTLDREDGGINFNDASRGLQFQAWLGRILNNNIVLEAPGVAPSVRYSGASITEMSFTFDQNARETIAFVEAGQPKLRWFDPVANMQVVDNLDASIVTPKVALDDKHPQGLGDSDIILAYVRAGGLYFRAQRDRYTIEYQLAETVPAPRLLKIGLNTQYRMQFEFQQ